MTGFFQSPALYASGNVRTCRAVRQTGGASGPVGAECTAETQEPVGVSWEATKYPPGTAADNGYCAEANDPIPFLGRGRMANILVGSGGVTGGTRVISDSAGAAIAVGAATTGWTIGIVQDSASSGDKVQILVDPMKIGG